MAIRTEFGTRGGDRITCEIGGDGGTYYKAATEQPLTLEAAPITWLIDKVQCTKCTLSLFVYDPAALLATILADKAPAIVIRRNGVVYWCGWLDMEGIEVREDDLKGHVIELYFGDFAPLKQRRFARRGVMSFSGILSEAVAGLPLTYTVANKEVDGVDTSLLEQECSYYDALELVAEAAVCTIRQADGVIELTDPLTVRAGKSTHIGKIYGDNNVTATGRVINTITYKLQIPKSEDKEGVVDALKPSSVMSNGEVEYYIAHPTDGQTRYKSHPGSILATRTKGRAMWRYGSQVVPYRKGSITARPGTKGEIEAVKSYLKGDGSAILTLEGEPIDTGSNVPITVGMSLRGGAVLATEEEQSEADKLSSELEQYGYHIGVELSIQLIDEAGKVLASVAPVRSAVQGSEYKEVPDGSYRWDYGNTSHRVTLYRSGIGAGSGQGLSGAGAYGGGTSAGIEVERPRMSVGDDRRIRVTAYRRVSVITTKQAGLLIGLGDDMVAMAVGLIMAQCGYALLIDKVTINQPIMYSDDKDARYEVTAYLSDEVTESVTYDTRVAGVADIPAWAYNGSAPYHGMTPLRLFDALYPVYGVRGKEYALRIAGSPSGCYYDYGGDRAILIGYTADLYADRTNLHLQSISSEDYNGEEV
jgi:hypothetical protein